MATENRIENSGIAGQVEQIKNAIADYPENRRATFEGSRPGMLHRLEVLLDYALLVFNSVPPELVSQDRINTISQRLQNLLEHARTVEPQHYTIEYLDQAIEAVANDLTTWPLAVSEDWRSAVSNAATVYRRAVGRQTANINAAIEDSRRQLRDLNRQIAQVRQDSQDLAQARGQEIELERRGAGEREAALQTSITRLTQQVSATEARLDKQVARFDEDFSSGQEARRGEYAALIKKHDETLALISHSADDQAKSIIEKLETRLDESAKLLSHLAGGVTGSAYGAEAIRQGKTADRLRWIALGFGVAAAGAALWLAHDATTGSEVNWQVVSGRLALSALFAGLASYMATQSQRHRRREEEARHTELRLVVFDPFIRELSEADRLLVHKQLATSIFAPLESRPEKDEVVFSDQQVGFLQKLGEVFKR